MRIRILTEADEAALVELLTDEKIKQTYMRPDFSRQEEAVPLARRLIGLSREDARFVRGMEAEGTLVGFLNDVEIQDNCIELGYVVHPVHWNKGYATAALTLAIQALFQNRFRTVLCGAFEGNPASLRVMEKAGMEKIEKTDDIEYRGKLHRCLYCRIDRKDLTEHSN